MLECKDISIRAGEEQLFNCKTIHLTKGLIALVGRNGSGKSTFLNTLWGDSDLETGNITIQGKALEDYQLNELAKTISVVRAKPVLYGEYAVRDILMLGRLPYQNLLSMPSNEDHELVEEVSRRLGVTDLLDREYNLLSDGEKQLIMVGRAFVQDTDIILLDEPTAFLDLVNRKELLVLLKNLVDEKNKLIIFSTHHVEVLSKYCDGILLIAKKELNVIFENTDFKDKINNAFGLNE